MLRDHISLIHSYIWVCNVQNVRAEDFTLILYRSRTLRLRMLVEGTQSDTKSSWLGMTRLDDLINHKRCCVRNLNFLDAWMTHGFEESSSSAACRLGSGPGAWGSGVCGGEGAVRMRGPSTPTRLLTFLSGRPAWLERREGRGEQDGRRGTYPM